MRQELKSAFFNILLYFLGAVLVIFVLPKAAIFFLPFLIAWGIAVMVNPLIVFLSGKINLHRKHSFAIIVSLVLFLVFALFYILLLGLWRYTTHLVAAFPEWSKTIADDSQKLVQNIRMLLERLPEDRRVLAFSVMDSLRERISGSISVLALPTVGIAGGLVKGIPVFLLYFIVTVIAAYIFTVEKERIAEFLRRWIPKGAMYYLKRFTVDLKAVILGYFGAQFKISLVVAVILSIGFLLLRLPAAIVLAILTAALDFLPIFGAGAVLLPWALIKLLAGEYITAVSLLVLYLLIQLLRQILQPKMVGDSIGMPPILTLFCLYVGFKLRGIGGMIIAVPIGLLLLKLYSYGLFDRLKQSIGSVADFIREFGGGSDDKGRAGSGRNEK